ncbi:cytochrome b/b6 domain-containing protein [Mariprofundus sp. EBB-1]|uniref:cytochrome b/b6 domain-containing protein n=1 Tax=Mariprofundus sp. EBB-1 TaxID=2650971 RepID=UPI000EF26710|nr:cytochrome b/b6 domain-containing protein [Mariprofundus sp. EBB-1]RLL51759.1 cytochrome b/b6 domain-containing protein [Mariprofundus sp. EBB-1]
MVAVLGLNQNTSMADHSLLLRWLHAGVALGAVYQLVTSLVLLPPDEKGGVFGHTMMEAHELGGLLIAAIVASHFIWSLLVRSEYNPGLSVLVSCKQWKEAFALIRTLPAGLIGKAKLPSPDNSLAKIVEMLGLLVMVSMAGTGMAIWVGLPDTSLAVIPEDTDFLMQVHSLLSNLLWVYVIGHVCMTLAHARGGEPILQRISPFYSPPEISDLSKRKGFIKEENEMTK